MRPPPVEMKEVTVSHDHVHPYLTAGFLSSPSFSENWNKVASSCGYAIIFVVKFTKGKLLGLKRENAGELARWVRTYSANAESPPARALVDENGSPEVW